ncbi:hypothetical protein [Rubripirellula lacrimiformis]|nr:hypothetical protein [Rubripirellula lacrimiformis]
MLRSIKEAIKNHVTPVRDPLDLDAMSMTLHHCARLVEQQRTQQRLKQEPCRGMNDNATRNSGS